MEDARAVIELVIHKMQEDIAFMNKFETPIQLKAEARAFTKSFRLRRIGGPRQCGYKIDVSMTFMCTIFSARRSLSSE